jgi:tryptophanyl-tRNA synthetase
MPSEPISDESVVLPDHRIVSGMRPTGPLHLGHYFGVLKNWLSLQEKAHCFYFVADWHALTTEYQSPQRLSEFTTEMVKDWLSLGIDPERTILFRQSDITEHIELFMILAMITPLPWLMRVPSFKEQQQALKDRELNTYGFLGYPLLQTADILAYRAHWVPVGADQIPHLELSREVVRHFHFLYQKTIFPEPQPLLTPSPKVPGMDGRKMSKSYNNAIFLNEPLEGIEPKVMRMITDPARVRRNDPGHPEVCDVFTLHKLSTPIPRVHKIEHLCRTGEIGCVECKRELGGNLKEILHPLQERRKKMTDTQVFRILKEGAEKARAIAQETLAEVKSLLGFSG